MSTHDATVGRGGRPATEHVGRPGDPSRRTGAPRVRWPALLPRSRKAVAVGAATVAIVGLVTLPARAGTAAPVGQGQSLPGASLPSASASGFVPHRPARCTPPPSDPNAPSPGQVATPTGTFPWPPLPLSGNPEAEAVFDHTPKTFPPIRPANWDADGNDWKLTSARSSNPELWANPQELCGVEGNSVDRAWQVTTGSPRTVIAVTDSGIEWCDPGIVDKVYLNRQALPLPENPEGLTKPELERQGVRFRDPDPYDLDNSGVFNVEQYAEDPRVQAVAKAYGGLFCQTDQSGASFGYHGISPADLIRTFGRPTLPGDRPNPYYLGRQSPPGFTEAIAGWNFLDDSNDPYDDVHYDHGTGEAQDSTGAANTLAHEVGACPNCMILPIRVGDSFIASANAFAEGVLFAVDSGASVIQEALGTVDVTETARQAIDYAEAHGVPVVASAADEEAEHHNEPANLAHTIVVNSVTEAPEGPNGVPLYNPPSYLYLNGCTNYGANIAVSVESSSCSSEATGKAAGILGLAISAAAEQVAEGRLRPYPGLTSPSGAPVPLSANELRQLVTMAASDVDFATAAPPFPPDNYAVAAPVPTTRYPTTPGFDLYTGYGRIDAARIVSLIAHDEIPPQAEIMDLPWFEIFPTSATLRFHALFGTPRRCPGHLQAAGAGPCPWRAEVQVAPGPAPLPGSWRTVEAVSGRGVRAVSVAIPLSAVAALFPPAVRASGFEGGPVGPAGRPEPDKFSFTVRVVVEDVGPGPHMVGMARRTEFLHDDPDLLFGGPRAFGGSIDTAPTLAPLGPHGEDVLLVATANGTVHALLPDGEELPGWPVHTAIDTGYHPGEEAYRSGAVSAIPHGEIIGVTGGLAVGDLTNASGSDLDVVATDDTGRVYAWNRDGKLLPGFPVRTDAAFSGPSVRNPNNRVLRGIFGAAALAPLQGSLVEHGRRVTPLDIVVAALDRHVYAWQPDGKPVPGWPVLVVDPSEVAAVDPVTNQVRFRPGANPAQGTKLDDTPAIGRLEGGSGPPDVVVGSSEEYLGAPNMSVANPLTSLLASGLGALGLSSANSRVYAIYPEGSLHEPAASAPSPPGYPNPGAFLPGWPVPIADLDAGLLPDVGDGITNSPALADLSGNGSLEVGVMSAAGPAYVLNPDGSSFFGTGPDGKPEVASTEPTGPLSNALGPVPSIPALGAPIFGSLGPAASFRALGTSLIAPALSLGKALDVALPADQHPHDNELDAWSTKTARFDPGFPQVMGDLQFFDQPIVADLGPNGPYAIEASATSDVRALNAVGEEAPGFPKFTGGWVVNGATFGPFGELPDQVLALGTREGELFVWRTGTPRCAPSGPWPMAHHDLWNTNNLSTKATPSRHEACSVQLQAGDVRGTR